MSGLSVKTSSYILFGGTSGFIGSLVDSVLVRLFKLGALKVRLMYRLQTHDNCARFAKGATVQATYYDEEKKCINSHVDQKDQSSNIIHVSGRNILTNAQVNLTSILITSVVGFGTGHIYF